MDYLIPILENCNISYQIIEENNLSFIYDEWEFISFTVFLPKYNILSIRVESIAPVNRDVNSVISTNQLRGEFSSYTVYPNIGVSFFYIYLPLKIEDKKTYFLNELDKIVPVLEQCNGLQPYMAQESISDVELLSFINKEYHNDEMFEENIIQDALDIIDQKDLSNFLLCWN